MDVLLQSDMRIRISFSCPGPLDAEHLPTWIKVQKIKYGKPAPFHRDKAGVLPSGLLEIITQTDRYYLERVRAREKMSDPYGPYSVIKFEFTTDAALKRQPHHEGIELLRTMLLMHWKRVKIYCSRGADIEETVSISFSNKIAVSDKTVFSEPDVWGIRRLL